MSLQPAEKNFTIWKGATFRSRLQLLTGDLGSTPQDLTGYTADCKIVDPLNPATVLLELSDVNAGIILGGTAGTIDLVIDEAVTAALTWRGGKYQLFITSPAGDTDILLYGAFKTKGY